MKTAAQAREECIAWGWSPAECDAEIASSMVGGRYCDGSVVITEAGKRCVPWDVARRVDAVSESSPLPPRPAPVAASGPATFVESTWFMPGLVAGLFALMLIGLAKGR